MYYVDTSSKMFSFHCFFASFFTAAVRNSKITVVNIGVKAGIYVSQVHKKKWKHFITLLTFFVEIKDY